MSSNDTVSKDSGSKDSGSKDSGSDDTESKSPLTGPIAWMANNTVAANLLMFIIIVGGILALTQVKQEVFPSFPEDIVTIQVPYPGASPEEVEQGIALAVEEAVRGLDGVKKVGSTSNEGVATVRVELLLGYDPDRALADVKASVDRITTFPEESEEPVVSVISARQRVISLILSGDQDLATLHALAEKARFGLLADPNITQVELEGVPALEIAVEIPRETLKAYGLSLDDVARQVTMASLEMPGGKVETRNGELMVRVSERKRAGYEFEDLVLRSTANGATVRLGDIANIDDGYAETDQASYFNGKPAVRVTAYRIGDETPQSVADAVKAYSVNLTGELPDNINVDLWQDDSELLRGRIDLLVRNAAMGFGLVVIILAVFLNLRLAFWVSLGIPISFAGAFLLMPSWDLSVNMISLFALIVTLGMVVDDAIMVGESAFHEMEKGIDKLTAAVEGARIMAMPVSFAILTSIAAFTPMFFVPGAMGKIFRLFPAVVVSVLIFSLIESFFILPAHLAHAATDDATEGHKSLLARMEERRSAFSKKLMGAIKGVYQPLLERTLSWRYVSLSIAGALFLATVGVLASGTVPFSPMPKIESDLVNASARLPYGASAERTRFVKEQLEASVNKTIAEAGGADIVQGVFARVGEGPPRGWAPGEVGSHLTTVEVSLVSSDKRDISAAEFADAWVKNMPKVAGVEALSFASSMGPGAGAAVDLQLSHNDTEVLAAASAELAEQLRTYPDLANVVNEYAAGKPQLDFTLLDNGRTLGLTTQDIARQLRAAFYGTEALREQRGRNEMKVMVRLPADQRQSEHALEELLIRTPAGGHVPLASVASFERGSAPTSIERESGRRKLNVSAELAPGIKSPQKAQSSIDAEVVPALLAKYPGLGVDKAGQQQEMAESLGALGKNYLLALFVIFALLAVPFRSYVQPLIVMFAIPFGLVGAVAGHMLMGFEMSMISMFGIVALSGVVVNDSLVLIDATNGYRRAGATAHEAITQGGNRRLRPILLTSLTTFFGLLPMIFETSVQARFLIPMALSLGFGILFATFIILLLVPALYMVVEDVTVGVANIKRWWRTDEVMPQPGK